MVSIALIGITTIIFGITALLLASRARKRLSPGSIRSYIDNFSVCLVFIVIFSIWQTGRDLFDLNIKFSGLTQYPEYIFIIFAYVAFIIASYKASRISHEFGFKDQGKVIEKVLNGKKKKKK